MFVLSIIHAVKSRLAVKLVLIFLLFGIVSILLTLGFMVYQRSFLTDEVLKRAQEQAQYLAQACPYYLDTDNADSIKPLDGAFINSIVSGAEAASGFDVFLVDTGGKVIACTEAALIDSVLMLPSERNSAKAARRQTAGDGHTIRTVVPIEQEIPIIEAGSPLHVHEDDLRNNPVVFFNPYLYQYVFPNFAPDSGSILVTHLEPYKNRRYLTGISIADSSKTVLIGGRVTNGFWSRSGRYLVYNHEISRENREWCELCVYETETDLARVIATDGVDHPNSSVTPDDRYVLTSLLTAPQNSRIFRIPLGGGKPEQLTFHSGNHWYPKSSPDGRLILYTNLRDKSQKNRMYVYDTSDKTSSPVFPGLSDNHRSGSFSPDGRRICYIRMTNPHSDYSWDIYVADFPVDASKSPEEQHGKRLTFTAGNKFLYTDWSPDGTWITFSQQDIARRRIDVCIVSLKTGEIRNLTASGPSRKQRIGYAVVDIPEETFRQAGASGNRVALSVGFIFTLVGTLIAFLLVRGIIRPVREIAEAARDVSRGNLDHRVETARKDEIGDLARSFNRMTGKLKISLDAVKAGYRELESLNEAKDNFISLVSHEIRTPLSSILVYADMLKNGMVKSDETAYKYHATIVDECRRLTRLINDVLDLSKMEAGRLTFHLEALDIGELVREVQVHFQPLIDSGELRFIDEGGPDHMPLRGDRDRIIQVLTNIVSNAIKFTPAGGTIRVSWKLENGKGIVAVSDTGKGIAEEDIPRVFDRFSQLENINHHTEGTGLGMAISKSIIERCDGAIWIESTPGKGTTVFFSLPLVNVERAISKPEDREMAEDKSGMPGPASHSPAILIVDDEEPIRTALTECVQSLGLIPVTACDGREALRLARLHAPAVVILDVMMPELSGLEVCRTLREAPEAGKMGIIMLSARGQEKEKQAGLEAGADRYIIKPFSYEEVMRTIEEFVHIDSRPA